MSSYMKKMRRVARRFRVSRTFRFTIWIPLLIISVLVLIFATDVAVPRTYVVEGAQVLSVDEIAQMTREQITAPLISSWLPGNLVFFPDNNAEESLASAFPRIAAIDVRRNIRERSVVIELRERTTHAIYCAGSEIVPEPEEGESDEEDETAAPAQQEEHELGEFPELRTEACYLMDATGVAFANAPETEGSLIMTVIDGTSGEVFHGSQVLSEKVLDEMNITWETFTSGIAVKPRRVLRRAGGIITIETFEGWEAVMSLDHPLEPQVVALRELIAKELDVTERRSITVIDLRVPGRIYYR